ncbi:MAG: NAD(P)-dependent oxidoreductase [Oliverpabstia sp.]
MSLHIIDEANRCLNCKKPMCQQGCPIHTPIPKVIQMFKEHKMTEAGETLFRNNPFSVVCSIVCNHEMQCEGHCVLGKKGNPIHFRSIENYISDGYLDRMEIEKKEKNGKCAAVIGAGPAGITVAVELIRNGYDVTIFEEQDEIGGVMRYGIPEFRLPKTIIKRYEKKLLEMGIQIRPKTIIGSALEIKDLFRDGYQAIFIGTGVGKPKTLGIRGESLSNVHFGINYLANPDAYHLGENVAVIGMGNVAMDVARTVLRHGSKHVTLYARGKRISASSSEMFFAELDGAEFAFGKAICAIEKEGPIFQTTIFDENDKVIGYEEELDVVKADSTIIAVSQRPQNKLILTTEGLLGSEKGFLIVDENGMTTCEGIFAAGDVVHGAKTVVHAVEEAKKTAAAMMRYMEK